jgi:hypothetical protein
MYVLFLWNPSSPSESVLGFEWHLHEEWRSGRDHAEGCPGDIRLGKFGCLLFDVQIHQERSRKRCDLVRGELSTGTLRHFSVNLTCTCQVTGVKMTLTRDTPPPKGKRLCLTGAPFFVNLSFSFVGEVGAVFSKLLSNLMALFSKLWFMNLRGWNCSGLS